MTPTEQDKLALEIADEYDCATRGEPHLYAINSSNLVIEYARRLIAAVDERRGKEFAGAQEADKESGRASGDMPASPAKLRGRPMTMKEIAEAEYASPANIEP